MKLITTLTLALVATYASSQTIFLVDNTPTAPTGSHVYSTLQAAVDASTPGTIIHVKPSGTSYGSVTITAANDSITIYGIGVNPDKEIAQSSTIDYLYISGNNIRISGIVVTAYVYVGYNATAGNVTLDNCLLNSYVYVAYNAVTSNVVIRNCLFYYQVYFRANANTTVVNNCVFSYSSTSQIYECYNGTLISHCLFFGDGGADYVFYQMTNSTVSNSIFYGREPRVGSGTNTNNTFNNCLAIYAPDTVFNGASMNGIVSSLSGGVFTDPDIALGSWDKKWSPALDPVSVELINAGDDGTDIGLTGGTIPYSVTGAPLPYIKSFVVPSVIKQGDDLDVTINALGN